MMIPHNKEAELRHMVAKLAAHVRPTCSELWAEAERLLNSTAPPSAPVGVEEVWLFKGSNGAWHTFHSEKHRLDTIADGGWDVRKFTTLTQQPAPVAPAGVDKETERRLIDVAASMLNDNNGKIGKKHFRADATAVVRRVLKALAPQLAAAPVEAEAERAFYAQDFYEEAREGKKPWPAQQPAAPSGETGGDWVTVPRVPTDAMLDAMHGRIQILCDPAERTADIQNDAEVWGAMLTAAPQQSAAVDGAKALAEKCRKAFSEELAAYDIDPPIAHVKEAHDACVEFLAAQQGGES